MPNRGEYRIGFALLFSLWVFTNILQNYKGANNQVLRLGWTRLDTKAIQAICEALSFPGEDKTASWHLGIMTSAGIHAVWKWICPYVSLGCQLEALHLNSANLSPLALHAVFSCWFLSLFRPHISSHLILITHFPPQVYETLPIFTHWICRIIEYQKTFGHLLVVALQ